MLINLILRQQSAEELKLRPVYYYTRPLLYPDPVPYGQYLVDYRKGNNIRCFIWIPLFVVEFVLWLVHSLAFLFPWVPYLESIDYLLQVSANVASFDNAAVRKDFPGLASQEETIVTCFERRRHYLKAAG